MDDTDFDFLIEGVSPEEAKGLRKILAQWCVGDENSFPVQLALLTRAQWRAAAQTTAMLGQSVELLERRLTDHRQQTATILKNINFAIENKTKALEEIAADHREAANKVLADLRDHAASTRKLLDQMQGELTNGARDLKKFRDDFIAERQRLEEARQRYESHRNWMDWAVILGLLLSFMGIGILIGWTVR